jgi:integrase
MPAIPLLIPAAQGRMKTAVDDGLIKRNPCRIDGAGQDHSPERPVLTVAQVFALADAFTDRRYRLLVLLAMFCSLRWGELAALPRYCVDTEAGTISVRASVVELARGPLVTGPTKSPAGNRNVTVPAFLLPDVIADLGDFTAADPRALVFTGPKGAQLRRSNFTRQWGKRHYCGGPDRLPLPRPSPYRQHARR